MQRAVSQTLAAAALVLASAAAMPAIAQGWGHAGLLRGRALGWLKAAEERASTLQEKLFAAGLRLQELEALVASMRDERDAEVAARRELEAVVREKESAADTELCAARSRAVVLEQSAAAMEKRMLQETRARKQASRELQQLQQHFDRKQSEWDSWAREGAGARGEGEGRGEA